MDVMLVYILKKIARESKVGDVITIKTKDGLSTIKITKSGVEVKGPLKAVFDGLK